MAKFIYRMENILNLQLKLEDQAKAAFAEANLKLSQEQDVLSQLMLKKAGYEAHIRDLVQGDIDFQEISVYKHGVESTESAIKSQLIRIRQAQKQVDDARRALNEAMKDRKTQEILKDKAFEQFKAELNAEELKVTDELNSFKYGSAAQNSQ